MNITSQDNSILIIRPEICDFDITVNLTEAVSTAPNNLLVTDSTGLFVGLLGTGLVRSVAGVLSYINGTSSQFVKANGTLDSNTYLTSEVDTLQSVTSRGAITTTSLTALSFIKTGGSSSQFLKADGSIDSNTYLTGNQNITLSGDVSGSGTTSIVTTIGAGKVTNSMLVNSFITINTSTGLSGGGTVSLGGSLTLVNTITQYTDAMARASVSLTTTGASGAAFYNSSTGVFNVPNYTASGLGAVPTTRILTINGTAQDLSADRTWSVGTVTSVGATAGTGISVSGSPITTSGSITITNTAPDQTIVLTNGTGISATGTYPNFTITNTAPDQIVALTAGTNISITGSYPNFTINATGSGTVSSVNLTAGTGISVAGGPITTSGSITVTNTAPDQVVSLTNGGGITVSGSYPNFTLTNLNTVSGTTNYISKFTGTNSIGNSQVFDNGTGVVINGTTPVGLFTVYGTQYITNTHTYVSAAEYALGVTNIATFSGSLSTSNASFSTIPVEFHSNFNGATTVGSDTQFGAILATNFSKFTSSGTVTMSGGNASSCLHATTIDDGSTNGTIDRSAGITINGIYLVSGATAVISRTNHYQLLINDTGQFGHATHVANTFAIYQVGVNDISRFFGPVQNASSSVQFTSDIRGKDILRNFGRGLSEIDQIETKIFNYKYDPNKRDVVGLIAQELETIIPEAVSKGNFEYTVEGVKYEYTDYRMIDQTYLFYTMLNAIKELSAKVKILENK